jgi:ADP-ribosylglycohydrolase
MLTVCSYRELSEWMEHGRIAGCLFGMAYGDALGAGTEFLSVAEITAQFPPDGPHAPDGNPALVTDDTQMALAVGEALIAAPRPFTPTSLSTALSRAFLAWYHSPDNTRAPGHTCLTACEALNRGEAWLHASQINSKGCGANMRVMPVGVLAVDAPTRAAIAQLQAAITHGHPTGLAAADLTAFTIADLGHGGDPISLPRRLRQYAESQRTVYHAEWLGDLWRRAHLTPTPGAFMERGWAECLHVLDRLDRALERVDRHADPCLATGAGWVAEEAFATALLCFLMYPDDPVATIRRAAVSSGDSDSIACIAGAFAGAAHGLEAWPADWLPRIEYCDRLQALCGDLSR